MARAQADRLATVFAGQDLEATARAREYFSGVPPLFNWARRSAIWPMQFGARLLCDRDGCMRPVRRPIPHLCGDPGSGSRDPRRRLRSGLSTPPRSPALETSPSSAQDRPGDRGEGRSGQRRYEPGLMSKLLEKQTWDLLRQVKFPGMNRDIVSFGFVDEVSATENGAYVDLAITTHKPETAEQIRAEAEAMLREHLSVREVVVRLRVAAPLTPGQAAVARDASLIPEVEHVVAVASGKGGVGKSTVAVNLAVKLGQLSHRVG
ncbi:MAG: DUF59 domain-containing protein, partial [Acidobacteria bacterium]